MQERHDREVAVTEWVKPEQGMRGCIQEILGQVGCLSIQMVGVVRLLWVPVGPPIFAIHPSIHHLSSHPFIFNHPFVYLSINIHPSIHLSIHPSTLTPCIYLFIHPPIHLSIHSESELLMSRNVTCPAHHCILSIWKGS